MNACMQGSPSTFTPTERETYRRGSSVTTWRAGKDGRPYLYTLNLACPEERWAELGGLYHKAADSFRLTPPTKVTLRACTNPMLSCFCFWGTMSLTVQTQFCAGVNSLCLLRLQNYRFCVCRSWHELCQVLSQSSELSMQSCLTSPCE